MSPLEFRAFMEDIAEDYHGDTYQVISKNCNHFTDDICLKLTGRPIPGWVNRLAHLGKDMFTHKFVIISLLPDLFMFSVFPFLAAAFHLSVLLCIHL